MKLAALALTAVLAAPVTTLAAEARASTEDPAVALARFVLSEETWRKMQAGTAAQLQQYIEGTLRQSGSTIPAGFAARFSREYLTLVSYQEMIDLQASLLAKHYTADEVRGLLAFYATPLGQKVIRVMPEVSQDLTGQMLTLIQQRLPALVERATAAEEAPADLPATTP